MIEYGLKEFVLDVDDCCNMVLGKEKGFRFDLAKKETLKNINWVNMFSKIFGAEIGKYVSKHNAKNNMSVGLSTEQFPAIVDYCLSQRDYNPNEIMLRKRVVDYSFSHFVRVHGQTIKSFKKAIEIAKIDCKQLNIFKLIDATEYSTNEINSVEPRFYGLKEFVFDLNKVFCEAMDGDRIRFCKSKNFTDKMIELAILYDSFRDNGEKQKELLAANPELSDYFNVFLKAPLSQTTITTMCDLETILRTAISKIERNELPADLNVIAVYPRIVSHYLKHHSSKWRLFNYIFTNDVPVDDESILAFEDFKTKSTKEVTKQKNESEQTNIVKTKEPVALDNINVTGRAEVKKTFKISNVGVVAGCVVLFGTIKLTDNLRIVRKGMVIHEGKISSICIQNSRVKEVDKGLECGICVSNFSKIKSGDIIEFFKSTSEANLQLGETRNYLFDQLVDKVVVGYLDNKKCVYANFRDRGNAVLHLNFKDRESELVTNFIISYILRSLEESSIGSLNIHILDKNDEWIFKRLRNCFDKLGKTESLKKIISITDDDDFIFNQINVVIDDVSKKILNLPVDTNNPDFYQLYKEDKNDALHLVVISSGFFDMCSDGSASKLNIIKEYVKQNSKGHKSGVRFLIIDDSNDRQDLIPDGNKVFCKTIYDNCELNILFDGKSFSIDNDSFQPILIQGDLDSFVSKLGDEFAEAVLNKQENEIYYDKIGFGKETHCELGPTISIPIGLSGTDIVSVPLSCSDRNNSAEGSNIGFMVIGMSGSGKSTFMHSLIINGCIKYSPKDLQFWLLDFKSGNATEKYLKANIPHIHLITENNKADDAFSIFNMLLDEMERRNSLFKKNNFSDVYSYNLFVKEHPEQNLEYLPRIIICIDEIQELFVDEQSHQLAQLIGRISSRMRVCGMHFVFISQNLSMDKTPYLVDAFLKHANGRVCFRISAEDTARNSHYPDEFIERDSELRTLSTCAAYVSYGPGTIKKVNVCRCTDELFKKYFSVIRETYSEYECTTLIIGSRKRLSLDALITSANKNYLEYISDLKDKYTLVLAENTYTLQPVELKITPNNNSSLLCLGSDNIMMSSICAISTICGLLNKGMTVHLMNGQKSLKSLNVACEANILDSLIDIPCNNLIVHKTSEITDLLLSIYSEYKKRIAAFDNEEEYDYSPVMLVINDLFGIRDMKNNVNIKSIDDTMAGTDDIESLYDSDLSPMDMIKDMGSWKIENSTNNDAIDIPILEAFKEIALNGYRVNIFVVASIKAQESGQIGYLISEMVSNVDNRIYFNNAPYTDSSGNNYYLGKMLENISGGDGSYHSDGTPEETLAVYSVNNRLIKIRPLLLSDKDID